MLVNKSKQAGVSVFSLLSIFIVIGFVMMVGFKVLPIYMNHGSISSSLESFKREPLVTRKSIGEIRKMLLSRFLVNDIKYVKTSDVKITNRDGRLKLSVAYAVKKPLMGNLSIVIDFDETVEVIGH